MSGEIINLRQKRKQAARDAARTKADANAVRHGRTKSEKALTEARAEKAGRDLDGHRRDGPGMEPADG